jgi:general stress protein CsbA
MPHAGEDDREAIDRAFADLVAGYHLTAERPNAADALRTCSAEPIPAAEPDESWASEHPLFRFTEPVPVVEPAREPSPEQYVPQPLPPMARPGIPALVGWVGIAYAVVLVMAATFGARIPSWAGWVAVVSFLAGFTILMTQLPRRRPPDAGDGAVL